MVLPSLSKVVGSLRAKLLTPLKKLWPQRTRKRRSSAAIFARSLPWCFRSRCCAWRLARCAWAMASGSPLAALRRAARAVWRAFTTRAGSWARRTSGLAAKALRFPVCGALGIAVFTAFSRLRKSRSAAPSAESPSSMGLMILSALVVSAATLPYAFASRYGGRRIVEPGPECGGGGAWGRRVLWSR